MLNWKFTATPQVHIARVSMRTAATAQGSAPSLHTAAHMRTLSAQPKRHTGHNSVQTYLTSSDRLTCSCPIHSADRAKQAQGTACTACPLQWTYCASYILHEVAAAHLTIDCGAPGGTMGHAMLLGVCGWSRLFSVWRIWSRSQKTCVYCGSGVAGMLPFLQRNDADHI